MITILTELSALLMRKICKQTLNDNGLTWSIKGAGTGPVSRVYDVESIAMWGLKWIYFHLLQKKGFPMLCVD